MKINGIKVLKTKADEHDLDVGFGYLQTRASHLPCRRAVVCEQLAQGCCVIGLVEWLGVEPVISQ